MSIMQVIDVRVVLHGSMAAARAVDMGVIGMRVMGLCHDSNLRYSARMASIDRTQGQHGCPTVH
jgi:hypothetical protein